MGMERQEPPLDILDGDGAKLAKKLGNVDALRLAFAANVKVRLVVLRHRR